MKLYTLQTNTVVERIDREGRVTCKESYIHQKYGEIAPIFLTAYRWLAREGAALVPPPEGAELFYWAFGDSADIERFTGSTLLVLEVPEGSALLFDQTEWNRILQLTLLGDEGEIRNFHREAEARGIKRETDILLTGFYPDLRTQVLASWPKLLRHHRTWITGKIPAEVHLQAALWEIRKEWITKREEI